MIRHAGDTPISEWDEKKREYKYGDAVIYEGIEYRCFKDCKYYDGTDWTPNNMPDFWTGMIRGTTCGANACDAKLRNQPGTTQHWLQKLETRLLDKQGVDGLKIEVSPENITPKVIIYRPGRELTMEQIKKQENFDNGSILFYRDDRNCTWTITRDGVEHRARSKRIRVCQ